MELNLTQLPLVHITFCGRPAVSIGVVNLVGLFGSTDYVLLQRIGSQGQTALRKGDGGGRHSKDSRDSSLDSLEIENRVRSSNMKLCRNTGLPVGCYNVVEGGIYDVVRYSDLRKGKVKGMDFATLNRHSDGRPKTRRGCRSRRKRRRDGTVENAAQSTPSDTVSSSFKQPSTPVPTDPSGTSGGTNGVSQRAKVVRAAQPSERKAHQKATKVSQTSKQTGGKEAPAVDEKNSNGTKAERTRTTKPRAPGIPKERPPRVGKEKVQQLKPVAEAAPQHAPSRSPSPRQANSNFAAVVLTASDLRSCDLGSSLSNVSVCTDKAETQMTPTTGPVTTSMQLNKSKHVPSSTGRTAAQDNGAKKTPQVATPVGESANAKKQQDVVDVDNALLVGHGSSSNGKKEGGSTGLANVRTDHSRDVVDRRAAAAPSNSIVECPCAPDAASPELGFVTVESALSRDFSLGSSLASSADSVY
ncbi:conserved protein, unknown function [Trypanosoma equiperdum]|uniref:Uncharacterized protein n=1 Tax=Trypanosoma equiperdum TaxID=5694 RepID=A0A1G4I7D8_TRYEQ|nr:conserved protein, unknown function [Trypanosoma equiperdum]